MYILQLMSNFKIEIKWAIIAFVAMLLWMVLEKITGLHDQNIKYHPYLTMIGIIPTILCYIYMFKEKKYQFYNGSITFVQGLKCGLISTAFATLLAPIGQWIISYIISPNYFTNAIKASVEYGYYKTTEQAAQHFNFENYLKGSTFGTVIMGAILTVIIALIVSYKKTNTQSNA
jgi:hypothetical protein